jgi:hypothetical protein
LAQYIALANLQVHGLRRLNGNLARHTAEKFEARGEFLGVDGCCDGKNRPARTKPRPKSRPAPKKSCHEYTKSLFFAACFNCAAASLMLPIFMLCNSIELAGNGEDRKRALTMMPVVP